MSIISQMRVLCVEDDLQALSQLKLSLESFCKELYCVSNGEKALEIMQAKPIDVVITAVSLSKMDGLGLLQQVKKDNPQTAVILVSAYTESEYFLKAIEYKADGYLLKPLNLQDLFSHMTKSAGTKFLHNELSAKNSLLKVLRNIGGKKVQIIEYIFNNLDKNGQFFGTYDELTAILKASKPTVVNTFKLLMDDGILTRIKNGHYRLKKEFLV